MPLPSPIHGCLDINIGSILFGYISAILVIEDQNLLNSGFSVLVHLE